LDGVEEMPITLVPNPSHLEFVDPVVVGRARAAQEVRDNRGGTPLHDPKASLGILIHGDAAFPGQGVVAETLNMSQLPGYHVGGTIHIIANNQIGFTTVPKDSRSTMYASDLAKGFEIPIVHVNADDPHACIAVARMACAYREKFGKDFLIDLIGYRRWGHNEGDQPAFTQPRMYEKIRSHPRVREIWARQLEREGILTRDEAETLVQSVQKRLQKAKDRPASPAGGPSAGGLSADAKAADEPRRSAETAVPEERLRALNEALMRRPDGFTTDATLDKRVLGPRREALDAPNGILWAHAEALAFASLLEDGVPIRLTGQDSERGTFGQRNLVLHDPTSGQRYCPMQNLAQARVAFGLYNSPLSENAALGFEYGYSAHAGNALVLWEGQFGDFVNGAQVIIDQFLVSGQAKWGATTGLVLLLPHGYEGQGPEHSSARLERSLQQCAGDNIRVANCSTAAQYFHLLRRQAAHLATDPRPLVLMTPKSLLRHPRAASSLADLAAGAFQPVLDDPTRSSAGSESAHAVTRLILCSGKVYVDLLFDEKFQPRPAYVESPNIAVARVEELYPFPAGELDRLMAGYPNLQEVFWVQEEPQNMGAWGFVQGRLGALLPRGVELRYVGRAEAASPAEGSATRHAVEQNRIVSTALQAAPKPQRNKVSTSSHGR
jgi:2-oxoglutarate dehydrogenase E1 component